MKEVCMKVWREKRNRLGEGRRGCGCGEKWKEESKNENTKRNGKKKNEKKIGGSGVVVGMRERRGERRKKNDESGL